MGLVIGGANCADVFPMTNGTTPSLGTVLAIRFNQTIKTDVTKDDNGNYSVKLDNRKDDSDVTTFLETYISVNAAGNTETLTYENGTQVTGGSTGNPELLVIAYGGVDVVNGSPSYNKRKIFAGGMKAKDTSGTQSWESAKYNAVALEFTGFDLGGQVAIPSSYLNSSLVTTPTAITLTTLTKKGRIVWI